MDYEKEILELKKRIEVLEKAEHKRIVKKRNEIIYNIVKFLLITGLIVFGSIYVYSNFIKPYKEKVDNYTEKVESVESFIEDKLGTLQGFYPFS